MVVDLNHSNVRVSAGCCTDAPAAEIGKVPPAVVAQESMKEVHAG